MKDGAKSKRENLFRHLSTKRNAERISDALQHRKAIQIISVGGRTNGWPGTDFQFKAIRRRRY